MLAIPVFTVTMDGNVDTEIHEYEATSEVILFHRISKQILTLTELFTQES